VRRDRRCNIDDDIYEQDGAADAADWIVYDEFTECVSRVAAAWADDWADAEFAAVMEDYLSRELLPKMLAGLDEGILPSFLPHSRLYGEYPYVKNKASDE
jgi:hypothetical protein